MSSRLTSSLFFLSIVIVCVVLVLLGNWQLRRLEWKTDLIDRVQSRIHATPIPVPLTLNPDDITKEAHEYLRVSMSGRFLHHHETLVRAVTEKGMGYWVITPLLIKDSIILINRGFVTEDYKPAATRKAGLISGEVTVTGLLRLTEPEGQFLRKNVPVEDRWYSRDVGAIAKSRNLERVLPFFIDSERMEVPGGFPIGGMTQVKFQNNHLIYAITWYGLAVMLLFMCCIAISRKEESA